MKAIILTQLLILTNMAHSSEALADNIEYPKNSVVVVATPGFSWAAEDVSKVLGVRAVPLDVALIEAAEIAEADENVKGVVEVEVNLGQFYENVIAICRNDRGEEIWREKRMLNFGGGADKLARDMVRGLITKIKGKKCP